MPLSNALTRLRFPMLLDVLRTGERVRPEPQEEQPIGWKHRASGLGSVEGYQTAP